MMSVADLTELTTVVWLYSYWQEVQGHSGLKESQVLWLGEEEYIASSGFGVVRAGVLLLLLLLLLLWLLLMVMIFVCQWCSKQC